MADGEVQVTRPAIYIRWSTEDQGEGTTLEVQKEACQAFILSQGWVIREDLTFIDNGISGATLERPALSRLREAIQLGQVDCVVVYKLDRLSRTVLDMLKLVLEEWDGVCSVKSAREPIDTLTPAGKMFFYQLMSFAEWERNVIRDRTFSGKLRRAAEGKSPGITLPYGYRKSKDGRIEQDPEAAVIIQRIFRLYLSGLGCQTIAQTLNKEGLPTAKGGPWGQPSVGDILKNPAYMGTFVYGRTRTRKDGKRAVREPLVVKEGFYPALVTRQEFETVQKLRAERPSVRRQKGTGRSLGSQSLLSGILRCTCGHAYTGRELKTKGNTYRYYICAAVQKSGVERCVSGNIRQADLDNLVVFQLLTTYRGAKARQRLVSHITRDLKAQHERALVAKDEAERALQKLEESERRLKGWLLDGSMSLPEYRALQGELNAKLQGARADYETALAAERGALVALESHSQQTVLLGQVDEWETLAHTERKQLLRHFIASITVFRDRSSNELSCDIEWTWAAPDGAKETTQKVRVAERVLDRVREENARRTRVNGRFVTSRAPQ